MGNARVPLLNQVMLAGCLTRDPEARGQQGNVTAFSIACNEKFKKADGTMDEKVLFMDCVCFKATAGYAMEHLYKGAKVMVTGKLEQSEYQGRDGQTRKSIQIVAHSVQSLEWRDDGQSNGNGNSQSEGRSYHRPPGGSSSYQQPAPATPAGRSWPKGLEDDIPEDDIPF